MAIEDRQNLRGSITKPLVSCAAVAVGAMAVAARAVGNLLTPATISLLDLGAECGGTTRADVSECLELLRRQYISPSLQKLLTVLAEDIGDF